MVEPPEVRVGVIEDRREIREALVMLIGGTPGFTARGAFGSMEEALPAIARDPPHVLLIDLGLPGMSGIEGIRELQQRHPDLALLALTIFDDDERIFESLCAGACGYLLKKTPPGRLLEAIREAAEGGAPMSPEVARRVVRLFQAVRPPVHADYDLTPHEARLLRMLVEGHNYKSAAHALGVSVHTVSFHVRHVYRKLQVHSRTEAVAKALREHLVPR